MKRIKSLFDLIINDLIIIIKRIFSDCALCKWNIPKSSGWVWFDEWGGRKKSLILLILHCSKKNYVKWLDAPIYKYDDWSFILMLFFFFLRKWNRRNAFNPHIRQFTIYNTSIAGAKEDFNHDLNFSKFSYRGFFFNYNQRLKITTICMPKKLCDHFYELLDNSVLFLCLFSHNNFCFLLAKYSCPSSSRLSTNWEGILFSILKDPRV